MLILIGLGVAAVTWLVCKQSDQRYGNQNLGACADGLVETGGPVTAVGPKPYGDHAPAYNPLFPAMEDPTGASLFPRSKMCGGNTDCGNAAVQGCSDKWGYQLSTDSLMPASWRNDACPPAADNEEADWAKYAPSKQSFDRYLTATGSARLAINSRSPLGRQVGTTLMLRSQPPLPLSTKEHEFNDSSFRNDLVYQSVGYYPGSIDC